MRRAQQGITLMGFMIVLIIVGFFAYVAMRLVPMYTEYSSVSKALDEVAHDPKAAGADLYKIRDLIERHFDISYVDSIKPKDVQISRKDGGLTLSVQYDVTRPLFYNISLVGHFTKIASTIPGADKLPLPSVASPPGG
ncbi:MAG TPA: DUF4845 domain-containing protein [Xanthomonadaceae bacterium]|jgi:Tfp pilus assembly protein PilE